MKSGVERLSRAGFTLLELIVALSLSVFVLIGVISVATTMISYQLDSSRKSNTEGASLNALNTLQRDVRQASYLKCPGVATGCGSNTGDVLSGCTNWSALISGADKRVDPQYSNQVGDDCYTSGTTNNVKSFYYCTPNPSSDPRLIRYINCGTSCNIPAPGSCGTAAGGATMTTVVNAVGTRLTPGFWHMDGLSSYYERADDIAGVGLHFIVGVGTPTTTAGGGAAVKMPVSYKLNSRVGMQKSYNDSND